MIRRVFRVVPLIFAGCVAGCAVGPDYHPPDNPKGADAPLSSISAPAESTEAPPDAWWRLYDDATLDKLLDEAFAANTDLKAAETHLASARAVREAADAGRYPAGKLDSKAIYGRDPLEDQDALFTGKKPFSDWVFDATLDVAYEIDLFGHVQRTIEEAKANSDAVAAARDALKVTLAAETARAYADICAFGEQISVARRSVDIVSREAQITRDRNLAGANSNFDVARAEAVVAQDRAAIPPLEGARKAALFALADLLGRTPNNAPVETLACVSPPRLAGRLPIGDGTSLLRRRPDIREAERSLASAVAGVGVATADLFPRISLTGSYGTVFDKVYALGSENALAWGVGPSMSWTLPIDPGPRARVREAKADAATALAHFDSVVLRALQETESALSGYSSERDHWADLAEAQAKSRKAFDQAHDQFVAGALSNLDLITAEQTLVTADAAVAASDAAIIRDQIEVFKTLGGGWQTAEGPQTIKDR
jgi:NodT family efflux transporter outer membrane factor (OMF) lipoprotein